MKKFNASSIDMKQMSDVRGGGVDVTFDNVKVNMTKAKQHEMRLAEDFRVEVSGTVTVEN